MLGISYHAWNIISYVLFGNGCCTLERLLHAIFGQFLPPPPVTLRHTSRTPPKVHHTYRTPRFLEGLVQKPGQKPPCTNYVSVLAGVFSGGFVRGLFIHSLRRFI